MVGETIRNHLEGRYLSIDLHRPVIDEVERVATFYLWNLSGQIVGYQQYRPDADKTKSNHPKDGRYFTYRNPHTLAVWGVESLHLSRDVVFLTEGIFDACRLTRRGYSAIAALSNNPTKDLKNWLWGLDRKVIVVCDNDDAGKRLMKFGDTSIVSETDLGDSDENFVDFVIGHATLQHL